jgi:hypothetical protein
MPATWSEAEWPRLADEVLTGMQEWRGQHPTATRGEIEQAVDERLARLRARLVQDVALASAATEARAGGKPPDCPDCGTPMAVEGARTRHLRTTYEQEVALTRRYARCRACGTGLFPPG